MPEGPFVRSCREVNQSGEMESAVATWVRMASQRVEQADWKVVMVERFWVMGEGRG